MPRFPHAMWVYVRIAHACTSERNPCTPACHVYQLLYMLHLLGHPLGSPMGIQRADFGTARQPGLPAYLPTCPARLQLNSPASQQQAADARDHEHPRYHHSLSRGGGHRHRHRQEAQAGGTGIGTGTGTGTGATHTVPTGCTASQSQAGMQAGFPTGTQPCAWERMYLH